MTRAHFRQAFTLLFKILFSFGLIAWLIWTDRLSVRDMTVLLAPQPILIGLSTIGLALLLSAERWRALLQSQGFQADRSPTYKMTLVGTFFSFFLPGGVGGDVVKAYYVVKNIGDRRAQAIGTVIFDRIFGLFTMVLYALLTCAFEYQILEQHQTLKSFAALLLFLFVAFMLCFWLLWSRHAVSFRNWILGLTEKMPPAHRMLTRLNQFQLSKFDFVKVVALSLISQSFSLLFFIMVAPYLGESSIPLSTFLFCVPMGFMATAIPVSPGGIGVGQAAFLFLFSLVLNKQTPIGALLITAFQLSTITYGLVGAFFYVMQKKHLTNSANFIEPSL